jgi:hypothetical protein
MNKLEAEQAFGLTRFEGWLTIAGLASGRRGSATSDSAFGPATILPLMATNAVVPTFVTVNSRDIDSDLL